MKFSIHRTKKDCSIPASALAVAGLKKEKELRLEAESGVIVVMRAEMNAKKMFAVSEFLYGLATRMAVAVAMESGVCCGCGDCLEDGDDCECDYCDSRDECHGVCVPDCLLAEAGIGADQGWQAHAEDGVVSIRALPDDGDDGLSADDIFPDEVPESARLTFIENDICIPCLRELLCNDDSIPF